MTAPNGDSRRDPTIDVPCVPCYGAEEMVRGIMDTMPPKREDRVLLVGCAGERPSRRLAKESGAQVVNVDLHALDSSLPVGVEAVNQVWCVGATTHVDDLARFVGEVARVLRPGGLALVVDTFWDGFRPPRFADRAGRAWRAVATKSLVSLMARSGLCDVDVLPWPDPAEVVTRNGARGALAEDLADGRLSPALVAARKP
jgi:SAM-dependent methyltransferase